MKRFAQGLFVFKLRLGNALGDFSLEMVYFQVSE